LFLQQMVNHLSTVVEELNFIPNKTRVRAGDEWKRMFTFTIPEWKEDEAKQRLRSYIDWIVTQIDEGNHKLENGEDDVASIRKSMEMWLQTRNLLKHVFNNEVMKVSCRKIASDHSISTRSYTWEQSNAWSGGEKWSKNMTLFLGILNYVAEKKQPPNKKMKRHRTVILDNPFGKASSDHVLSPVFFIAEQLGFQFIALTAHAEGKFLQDYFPIIYSLRLRNSADPTKQIMTKELTLKHAYFQDHAPQSLERIGPVEQLDMFEAEVEV
ncbi:MAG: hypothetical protein ACRC5C_06700, partial [Bacilli bacterium]